MVRLPESLSVETGLSFDFAYKELKLNDMLGQWSILCAERRVSYALFGGTAINKAYLDQPRFSEDADFFVYGLTPVKMDGIIQSLDGFTVSKPIQIFRELYRWTLTYSESGEGVEGTFQLDVNFHFKKPATIPARLPLNSFLSRFGVSMVPPRLDVLPLDTLVAMKLLALQSRMEGKDFYDLYRILGKNSFSKSRILEEARKYSQSLFDFQRFDAAVVERAVDSVKKVDVPALEHTDAYILKPHRPDWGALKKDLVRLLISNIV
ncbi:nucleotidyl transferase AbiEii/AbiGii toxin family protein [Candidatus Micrarchaeota archaeon]|nr:nucleotidyl transferase AbiEii/AbiGii toxin family protein [Candidatus Micrarchaeota archaeon]